MYALLLYESFLCFLQMWGGGSSCKICTSMCFLENQNIHLKYLLKRQMQESWKSRYYQDIGYRKIMHLLIPPVVLLSGRKDYMDNPKNKQSKDETLLFFFFFFAILPPVFLQTVFQVRFLRKQTLRWSFAYRWLTREVPQNQHLWERKRNFCPGREKLNCVTQSKQNIQLPPQGALNLSGP